MGSDIAAAPAVRNPIWMKFIGPLKEMASDVKVLAQSLRQWSFDGDRDVVDLVLRAEGADLVLPSVDGGDKLIANRLGTCHHFLPGFQIPESNRPGKRHLGF